MTRIKTADESLARTYARSPVEIVRGSGAGVWDSEGKSYLDFTAGVAVCALGHAHPGVTAAVSDQAARLLHISNLYYTPVQTGLAARLTEKSFADRVFFCNSGAEANEAAIKLARKYFSRKGETGRFKIISLEGSFHGRTFGAMSATGQEKIRAGFGPLLEGFDFVPFNDPGALAKKMDESVCAMIMEPVQGEGGVRVPDPGYLKEARRVCDENGAFLIFDEIQTGMGRTGTLFAHEAFGAEPDIMTLAKALANGLPMGAMLATEKAAAGFSPGDHGSTFGGNPVAAAAALEVLKEMDRGALENCRETGAYFMKKLLDLKDRHEHIRQVRGMGLLLGAELDMEAGGVVAACLEKGFLINSVQGNVLRFIPPLIIEKKHIDALIQCLDGIFGRLNDL
ncbi:Acetylornithine aminotransferase [Candidatus Desulfarcum epimagneticum]|uniref:Acetylornithine aminotransferase n=1 Tax=uncultured Desulfobacteraceae bacterium TaxID=218296 RepID=A0A484HIH5_9BACT|nr:Acetylornithine aminotransferase [uncultured Desulfobacteraceae bacterium]